MQKTGLDRWLQKKYIYVTQVYCNTLPHHIPSGVDLDETTEETGGRYLYRFTTRNDRELNELTAHLEVENITYTSRIGKCGGFKAKLFNDPQKSFTMGVFWVIFIIIILAVIFSGLPVKLWNELSADDSEPAQANIEHHSIDIAGTTFHTSLENEKYTHSKSSIERAVTRGDHSGDRAYACSGIDHHLLGGRHDRLAERT